MKHVFLALAAMVFFACAHETKAQVVVIANPSVKATDISKSDLHDIFTGNSATIAGTRVSPVLLKDGAVHTEFLNRYIGKSETAFRATWRGLVFSGQGAMPHTAESDAAAVAYVAHTPGTIGYIEKSTPHEGVKILTVR